MPKKKTPMIVVQDHDAGWEGIYIDNVLVREDHSINLETVLKTAKGREIKLYAVDMGENGHLPDRLEDVKITKELI